MAYEDAAKNLMLDALGVAGVYASLHIVAGTEVTGGSPAYARKAIVYNAASGGAMTAKATLPVFDVPACTVAQVGIYSALTNGTKYCTIPVTNEVFAAQGTYTVSAGTLDLNA
ncbi:MAG TPA: hypothetical protein VMV86_05910 [Methanosarcinales archaeon]|nr:hypothetical protein [Methanosarcinales archaeon]